MANAPPSNKDIARVATGVLANPAAHIGKNYRPSGPELISPQDIAGILGHVLGRKVSYKDVPFKSFSKAAVAQGFALSDIAQELSGTRWRRVAITMAMAGTFIIMAMVTIC